MKDQSQSSDPAVSLSPPGLEGLGLSTKTRNALWNAGIVTLDDICAHSAGELRRLKRFGRQAVAEVRVAAQSRGRRLSGDVGADAKRLAALEEEVHSLRGERARWVRHDIERREMERLRAIVADCEQQSRDIAVKETALRHVTSAIVNALRPFPEARAAVIAAIEPMGQQQVQETNPGA